MVEMSILPSHGTDHGAYILYCYSTPKTERITHLKFRLYIAKALLEAAHPVPELRYQPPPDAANVPLRLTGRRFPELAGGRPDCKDRAAGKRKQTRWSVIHIKWLCVHTHALNATIPSSITNRFQQILYSPSPYQSPFIHLFP